MASRPLSPGTPYNPYNPYNSSLYPNRYPRPLIFHQQITPRLTLQARLPEGMLYHCCCFTVHQCFLLFLPTTCPSVGRAILLFLKL